MGAFYRTQDAFRVTLVPSLIVGVLNWPSFKHLWRPGVATFQWRCSSYYTSLQTNCALNYNNSNQHRIAHAIQKKRPRQVVSRECALSHARGRMILTSRGWSPNWTPLQHSLFCLESVLKWKMTSSLGFWISWAHFTLLISGVNRVPKFRVPKKVLTDSVIGRWPSKLRSLSGQRPIWFA